ncbi:Peroxisomal targeting signal 1 receptor family [Lasallia pustulata]|uniref:Peroxisomal targeting signal 1 receptor family n=1 Tax=Lasallia pustulata TaxID=136370 RepID=A0A1W5D710_9LECA|nr:Peroxisomal targeting signal 1 receptor family [Lasallia pustulata]
MADALCGPSNALQSFQKHTSVDRTLQQDRLALRQSPAQGFRSAQPNAGVLDAEFEAFQAGHPFGAGLPTFEQPQYNGPATSSSHVFPHPQLPDWASDFESLHLGDARSSPIPQSQFRQEAPLQRNVPGGWQQDFMRQQSRQMVHQQPLQQQFNGFSQSMYQTRNYPAFDSASSQLSPVAQLKQPQQEDVFDEVAFEKAFEDAKAEMEQVQEQQGRENMLSNTNNLAALSDYQTELKLLGEHINNLRAGRNMQWNTEQNQWVEVQLGNDVPISGSADLLTLSDHLVEQERIGSDRILHQDDGRRADTQLHDEADDLARTAGQLLDSVKHEQSQKFQESSFLALMRQLRDREVRVEGDRMINATQPLHPGGAHYPRDRDTTMTGAIYPDDPAGADKANATA